MFTTRNTFRYAIILAVAVMFVFSIVAIATAGEKVSAQKKSPVPQKPLLDGKIFDGKLTENIPEAKPVDETMTFANGMLSSTVFEAQGYKACAYKTKKSGSKITFTATATKGDDPGTILQWSGTVDKARTSNATFLAAEVSINKEGKSLNQYGIKAMLRQPVEPPPAK